MRKVFKFNGFCRVAFFSTSFIAAFTIFQKLHADFYYKDKINNEITNELKNKDFDEKHLSFSFICNEFENLDILSRYRLVSSISFFYQNEWGINTIYPMNFLCAVGLINPSIALQVSYVIKYNDKVIGMYTLGKPSDTELCLSNLFIHKSFRSQGIGSKVVTNLKERCVQENRDLVLHTEEKSLNTYYSKLGGVVDNNNSSEFTKGIKLLSSYDHKERDIVVFKTRTNNP